jgi:hypothetical protein
MLNILRNSEMFEKYELPMAILLIPAVGRAISLSRPFK